MENTSPYHGLLIFIGVFGAAALWFTGYILLIKLTPLPPPGSDMWQRGSYFASNRFWGAIIAIPPIIYVAIIAHFW